MILSFGSKETEKIWNGDRVKNLPHDIQQIGRRKLRMLNNSQNLLDLKIPPSNKLEKLSGKMKDLSLSKSDVSETIVIILYYYLHY